MTVMTPSTSASIGTPARQSAWAARVWRALLSASVAVVVSIVCFGADALMHVPLDCPDGHRLIGSYRAGMHWCAVRPDGQLVRDGPFVTWSRTRGPDGWPLPSARGHYRAGQRHGTFVDFGADGRASPTFTEYREGLALR